MIKEIFGMIWLACVLFVTYGFWANWREKNNLHANIFLYIKEKIIEIIQIIQSIRNRRN